MVAIGGGKRRKEHKPSQPQWVVQLAANMNQYALISLNEKSEVMISWVGDPNAATKFSSKYNAKMRVRDLENIPETRVFKELETKK